MTMTLKMTAALVAATAMMSTAVLADGRAPTAEESAAIGSALQSQGFSKWAKVELDDGKWEIDNAVHSDGKIYDVDLKVSDLSVIKKDLED